MRNSVQGQVKKVKYGQILKLENFDNKDMFLMQNGLSNQVPVVQLVFT